MVVMVVASQDSQLSTSAICRQKTLVELRLLVYSHCLTKRLSCDCQRYTANMFGDLSEKTYDEQLAAERIIEHDL